MQTRWRTDAQALAVTVMASSPFPKLVTPLGLKVSTGLSAGWKMMVPNPWPASTPPTLLEMLSFMNPRTSSNLSLVSLCLSHLWWNFIFDFSTNFLFLLVVSVIQTATASRVCLGLLIRSYYSRTHINFLCCNEFGEIWNLRNSGRIWYFPYNYYLWGISITIIHYSSYCI